MSDKLYLVTIGGNYDRVLQLPIDQVEQYAVNRGVASGYLPLWRTEHTPDDIEYGIAHNFSKDEYAGLIRIQVIRLVVSIEDKRYAGAYVPNHREDNRLIWEELRQRGQGKDHTEPQGTLYTLAEEKEETP